MVQKQYGGVSAYAMMSAAAQGAPQAERKELTMMRRIRDYFTCRSYRVNLHDRLCNYSMTRWH